MLTPAVRSAVRCLVFLVLSISLATACYSQKQASPAEESRRGLPVRGKVVIARDAQGVPHIQARDPGDLFFGLGFAMAQDRLFQMDFYRHAAQGRLCEWFGNLPLGQGMRLIQVDLFLKCFAFGERGRQAYSRIAAQERFLLDRFVEGINSGILQRKDSRPFTYRLLLTEPEPWTPEDVLAQAEVFGLGLALIGAQTEILGEWMKRACGRELAEDFLRRYSGQADPGGGEELRHDRPPQPEILLASPWKAFHALCSFLGAAMPRGSNNWAVAPHLSASGLPMLANDPHVPLGMAPSFWYHAVLEGEGFAVQGLLYPGYPAFAAGWNGHVAWGVTNLMADQIDLAKERLESVPQPRRLTPSGWQPLTSRHVTCRVRLGRDRSFEVLETGAGFLVPVEVMENEYSRKAPWLLEPISLRYVDTDPAAFFEGQIRLMAASDSAGLLAALREISQGPTAFHYVWADRAGEIGAHAAGKIPERPDGQGSRMREAWAEETEWVGYVPFESLPAERSPRRGFVHSANERIAPAGYPWYITDDNVRPFRSMRIRDFLSSGKQFRPEDFMALQSDLENLPARTLVPLLLNATEGPRRSGKLLPSEIDTLGILEKWDMKTEARSAAAALFELFHQSLLEETFQDEMGKDLSEALLRVNVGASKVLDDLLDEPESVWFDRRDTPQKETRDEAILAAFRRACRKAEQWMGKDPSKWAWGKIHTLYLGHPLGLVSWVGAPFRIGVLECPGDNDTVSGFHFMAGPKGFPVFAGPASRMIVDLARTDGAWFNCSTGMSGEPFSPYFENLASGWYRNEYFWTCRAAAPERIGATARLMLLP